jgi:AcrR family transcriptional regulator
MGVRLTAERRREAILEAAMGLFARRGFSGVTTRELAGASGISEAMLFRHFPRKEALYRAILQRHLVDAERAVPVAGIAESEQDPETFFRGIADTFLRRMDADPTLLRLMLFSALEGHALAREFERARGRGMRRAIQSYLRRQVRRGAVRRVDTRLAARSFLWLVAGFGISRQIFRERGARAYARDALVDRLVTQYLDGLLVPARRRRRRS